MWRILSASVVGTSHTKTCTPCQDFNLAQVWSNDSEENVLLCVCADGAGTAKFSDLASRVSCEVLRQQVIESLNCGKNLGQLTNDDIAKWFRSAHAALVGESERASIDLREFATTALVAVVGGTQAIFGQIGDGAIAVDDSRHPVFWPDSGEYLNTTAFLTDQDFERSLRITVVEEPINQVALFTDGLQLLALNYADQTVHRPFFDSMFRAMRETDNFDQLRPELFAFLDSVPVNSRTDDDKTLILAQRITDEDEPTRAN